MPRLEELAALNLDLAVLRETKVGAIVGRYRAHSAPAVANKAKELVSSWKRVVIQAAAASSA